MLNGLVPALSATVSIPSVETVSMVVNVVLQARHCRLRHILARFLCGRELVTLVFSL